MTAVIFGVAAFVWSGWAQERPPAGWPSRVALGLLSVLGLALVGIGVPRVIASWTNATAIDLGSGAFVAYTIVFWIEVVAIVVLAVVLKRAQRSEFLAPSVLLIVGVHLLPLALVFEQWILFIAGLLVAAAGIAAMILPRKDNAPSFWCGILGAPIFLAAGAVCLIAHFLGSSEVAG